MRYKFDSIEGDATLQSGYAQVEIVAGYADIKEPTTEQLELIRHHGGVLVEAAKAEPKAKRGKAADEVTK